MHPTMMSGQAENARLSQKMIVFKYVGDDKCRGTKEILVSRGAVAQYDVRGLTIHCCPLEDLLT